MSATATLRDPGLAAAVDRHLDLQLDSARRLLDLQLDSARRLLELVLRQGSAIRERDTEAVLARLAEIKTEMAAREGLERERSALIDAAAARLGLGVEGVTLSALGELMSPAEAEAVQARSAELRGLLAEIAREHGINRALMRQELTFLDHLIRLVGEPDADGGNRLMDVEA